MNHPRMTQLIDSMIDGDVSEAELIELEAELSVDPALRKEYLERLAMDMLLEQEVRAESLAAPAGLSSSEPPLHAQSSISERQSVGDSQKQLFSAVLWFAMAACIGGITFGWLAWRSTKSDSAGKLAQSSSDLLTEESEEQVSGYAVISGQEQANWHSGALRPNGSLLPTGELQLSAGIVQLDLFSGVSVVIEGPAKFSVNSPMHMHVAQGRVRAQVPEPAHGFRLTTREGEIIDLGTDFAVDVQADQSELHVLEGEVELHPHGEGTRRVEGGQALRLSVGGEPADLIVDQDRFSGPRDVQARLQASLRDKHNQWLAWVQERREDPRLVAYYQMALDDSSSRLIQNQSTATSGRASDGTVVAAQRSADRWQTPEDALNFSPTGSRVRLSIPGEFGSITLMCWVRINSLDRWYNSLFLTDGHEEHEPHWQIMDDGRLFFSVKKRDVFDLDQGERDKHVFYSPPFWNATLSGQWIMLATVYDIESKTVTHYLNGQPISEETIPEEYLVPVVRIGNASIGNWGLPERQDPKFAVRNLNGVLDEFAMFDAALSAAEIEDLYNHGNP